MIVDGYSFNPADVTHAFIEPVFIKYEIVGYCLTIRTETSNAAVEHDIKYKELRDAFADLERIDQASYKAKDSHDAIGFAGFNAEE